VLRKFFFAEEVLIRGGWRGLPNEEVHKLCSSPNIIKYIKSKETETGRECSTPSRDEKCI
jgi:hypothetical protein